jgi:hypothetical protein
MSKIEENRFMELLERKLEEHWKNTKDERERTHTSKIYRKLMEREK